MNVDGNFIIGFLVVPFFIVEVYITETISYNWVDIVLANTNILCIIIASTGLTAALNCGQAGPVQAIEMMKTVWQIILTIAIDQLIPNTMEFIGCATGISGVILIVLMKKR